jgi:hypothetical protein
LSNSSASVLVDSNSTPIGGDKPIVQFVVAPQRLPAEAQSDATRRGSGDRLEPGGMRFERPTANQSSIDSHLPKAGSPLPLISVIGFGILVGGIVSAMKTRS